MEFFASLAIAVSLFLGSIIAVPLEWFSKIDNGVSDIDTQQTAEFNNDVKLFDSKGVETPYNVFNSVLYYHTSPVDLSLLSELGMSLDLQSFEIIDKVFSKDSQRVYFNLGQKFPGIVENADPATFRHDYDDYYGVIRDAEHVWIMDALPTLVEEADPVTFERILNSFSGDQSHGYYRDKNRVYKHVGGHMLADAEPVHEADVATFKYVPNNEKYDAEDKNYKYYSGEVIKANFFFEAENSDWVIDTNIFTPVSWNNNLWTDSVNVYDVWGNIVSRDAAHFEKVNIAESVYLYAKDSKRFYVSSNQSNQIDFIDKSDPQSFKFLEADDGKNSLYAVDKNLVYSFAETLGSPTRNLSWKDVPNASTTQLIRNADGSKSRCAIGIGDQVFMYSFLQVPNVDAKTFRITDDKCLKGKDANSAYTVSYELEAVIKN